MGEMPGGVYKEETMCHKHMQGCGGQNIELGLYSMWEALVSLVLCVDILVIMGEGLMWVEPEKLLESPST